MDKLVIIGERLGKDERIRPFLEREGFESIYAATGAEGLAAVRAHGPAVVIVDHQLQDDDGVDVLKRVRSLEPLCEVVLVTPGGEMEVAIEVLRAGALDYLRHPLDLDQLSVALGRARERRRKPKTAEPAVILVIEDHEPTRRRLLSVLQKEGYRVHGAEDGEAGVAVFNRTHVDLILADLRMPKKDGLTVLRETKGESADVEAIVMTGYGDEDVVIEALRQGAVNFLRKPIDIEQMLLAIQKALDFQRVRRSLVYRTRDVEIMQELVVRLTNKLELVVETPEQLSQEALAFLHQLVDALPLGIIVADAERRIVYANRRVLQNAGETGTRLTIADLRRMGLGSLSEDELEAAFRRAVGAHPGTIETLVLSEWSFLIMTPLKIIRPGGGQQYVALAIRGERRAHGDAEEQ